MNQDEAIEYLRQLKESDNGFQGLCKMCGRCCRLAVSAYSHAELLERAENKDPEAISFLGIFKKYSSPEEAKAAVPEHFERIVKELSFKPDFDINNVSFYYCANITENNLCKIHEKRPECCRRAPGNGWALFPPGCGFEGWQFEQREYQKKVVRRLKEILYELEFYDEDAVITKENKTARELKEDISGKIELWKKYGSDNW